MGRACSTIVMRRNAYRKERDHWEDQDVSGWTILK
jgi:hypothetical protein